MSKIFYFLVCETNYIFVIFVNLCILPLLSKYLMNSKFEDDLWSIKWLSLAGQGAMSAAGVLAQAMSEVGFGVQSIPCFGAEKRGAMVTMYNRFSRKIRQITDPSHPGQVSGVVLFDTRLLERNIEDREVTAGLIVEGFLLINSASKEVFSRYPGLVDRKKSQRQIFYLDASGIALKYLQRDLPNMAIVSALVQIFELDRKQIRNFLAKKLPETIGETLAQKNLLIFDEAETKLRKLSTEDIKQLPKRANENSQKNKLQKYQDLPRAGIIGYDKKN